MTQSSSRSRTLRRLRTLSALALSAAVLAACGGGGSDAPSAPAPAPTPVPPPPPPPPPPSPPPAPSADEITALEGKVHVFYRPFSSDIDVIFNPAFGNEVGYRVDRLQAGVWTAATTWMPHSHPSGYYWTDPAVAEAYRVVALLPGRDVILKTAQGINQVNVRTDLAGMSIVVPGTQPLVGVTRMTIPSAPAASTVTWFAYPRLLPTDTPLDSGDGTGTDHGFQIDPAKYTDGGHLVRAVVQFADGNWIDVRRQVTMDTPHVTATIQLGEGPQTTTVQVSASADAGIARVNYFLDGNAVGAVTAPLPFTNIYQLVLDNATVGHGTHQLRVVATDTNGVTAEASQAILINSLPQVTLTSPLNHSLVSGRLVVRGTFTDDSSTVALAALLDGTQVGRTTTPGPFEFSIDLANYAVGPHTLTMQATDAQGRTSELQRRVQVQTANGFTYERVTEGDGVFHAARTDGPSLLFVEPGSPPLVKVTNFGPNGETVTLQGTQTFDANELFLSRSSGRVLGLVDGHVKRWGRDGTRLDVSDEAGIPGSATGLVAEGDWASWTSSAGLVLRTIATGVQQIVSPPFGTSSVVAVRLFPYGSEVRLVFDATTNGRAGTRQYFYDSVIRGWIPIGQPVNASEYQTVKVLFNGSRAIWHQQALSGLTTPAARLLAVNVADPSQVEVLSSALAFGTATVASDSSLVAWTEAPVGGGPIVFKVNDGQSTVTIPNAIGAANDAILAVGGGAVAYRANGKLYLWTQVAGSRLVLDGLTTWAALGSGSLYFPVRAETQQGNSIAALYRVAF